MIEGEFLIGVKQTRDLPELLLDDSFHLLVSRVGQLEEFFVKTHLCLEVLVPAEENKKS